MDNVISIAVILFLLTEIDLNQNSAETHHVKQDGKYKKPMNYGT
jgi:hypothetical protein